MLHLSNVIYAECVHFTDKTSVRETFPEVIGPNKIRVKWKKPLEKYKEFSYRAFIKWESPAETENMLEVYDGNATFCVYSIKGIAVRRQFYVMAYVVREIPLIRIVGMYMANFVSWFVLRD